MTTSVRLVRFSASGRRSGLVSALAEIERDYGAQGAEVRLVGFPPAPYQPGERLFVSRSRIG